MPLHNIYSEYLTGAEYAALYENPLVMSISLDCNGQLEILGEKCNLPSIEDLPNFVGKNADMLSPNIYHFFIGKKDELITT